MKSSLQGWRRICWKLLIATANCCDSICLVFTGNITESNVETWLQTNKQQHLFAACFPEVDSLTGLKTWPDVGCLQSSLWGERGVSFPVKLWESDKPPPCTDEASSCQTLTPPPSYSKQNLITGTVRIYGSDVTWNRRIRRSKDPFWNQGGFRIHLGWLRLSQLAGVTSNQSADFSAEGSLVKDSKAKSLQVVKCGGQMWLCAKS